MHAPRQKKRASVLVAVLAIILLLSFLVTRFMDEAVEDLEYRALFNEPSDLRAFTYSMLEVSLATLQEVALIDEGKLYAPEQGWANPIEYAGIQVPNNWEVNITIHDESSKLPINTISENDLNRLLEEELDIDFGTTRELSSTLADWIDPDEKRRLNGAESEDYLGENPAYKAANAPLQSLEELRLLKVWKDEFFDESGNPNELYQRLSQLVSVINTGAININSASQQVIDMLALQDGWQSDYAFDGIDEPYLKNAPAGANTSTTGTEMTLFRIDVEVFRGDLPFAISALVQPNISTQSSGGTSNTPGSERSEDGEIKTGTFSEQDALKIPFEILQLTEYALGEISHEPARYSAVDIDE